MRVRYASAFVLFVALPTACAHEDRKGPLAAVASQRTPSATTTRPQYLIADPSTSKPAVGIPLGVLGQVGLVVDRRRVVVGQGEPRVATDSAPDPLIGASRVPARFGGGFLFWTANALYRSDTFDAKLLPIARVPDPIEHVSFAPKALLAR